MAKTEAVPRRATDAEIARFGGLEHWECGNSSWRCNGIAAFPVEGSGKKLNLSEESAKACGEQPR